MTWEKVKFDEVIDINPSISMKKGEVYPFVEMANVGIRERSPQKIAIKEYDGGTRFEKGDTVIAGIEPCMQNGKKFYCLNITKGFGSTEFLVFRPHSDELLDSKFLYYFMQTWYIRGNMIHSMNGGTGRQRVNEDVFRGFEIEIPEIQVQKRIADILSAYDDLIENHQRQIRLLEEAAQRLYKEWFVKLRFPGHETTNIIDGVPEGWSRVNIKEILDGYNNGGWGKKDITAKCMVGAKVIRGTDIDDIRNGDYKGLPLRYHSKNDINEKCLKVNDIVLELSNGNIDNVGRTLLIDNRILKECGDKVICASFCKRLTPKNGQLALLLEQEIEFLQKSGNLILYKKHGANGINNFDFDSFLKHKILIPDQWELLKPFAGLNQGISIFRESISILKEARDRLLPRLMRGELKV